MLPRRALLRRALTIRRLYSSHSSSDKVGVTKPVESEGFRTALVVSKLTKYEWLNKNKRDEAEPPSPEQDDAKLYEVLLRKSHDSHERNIESIVEQLREWGTEPRVVKADDLSPDDVKSPDIIFSAGGDGTYLMTASHLSRNDKPLIGINTDPLRSAGHLCSFTADAFHHARKILLAKEIKWIQRQRIEVTTYDSSGNNAKQLPVRALNEVFIAEKDPSQATYYEFAINDQVWKERHKCGGILICTGTGSSAWMSNAAKVHRDDVAAVLSFLHHTSNFDSRIDHITKQLNNRILFDPSANVMRYFVREPVMNDIFGVASRNGKADRVSIRSLCYNGQMTVDGFRRFDFPNGTLVDLQINDKFSLRTLRGSAGMIME